MKFDLNLSAGAVARVKLPFRLHMQVHGWWVPGSMLPFGPIA